MVELLFTDATSLPLQIYSGTFTDSDFFNRILEVRAEEASRQRRPQIQFEYDRYSEHYLVTIGEVNVGCLTVTRASQGYMDCEEYFPQKLLETFRPVTGSASKFRILKERKQWRPDIATEVSKKTIRTVWQHQICLGSRIDVMKVELPLVGYYLRLGYRVIDGSQFLHPRLGTPALVMYLTSDPGMLSIAKDLFAKLDDPLLFKDIQHLIPEIQEVPTLSVKAVG